ncbi:MAG: hypothetical protein ACI90V_008017 [Bacillariaceae sp.]|jgi:hypothetical protein
MKFFSIVVAAALFGVSSPFASCIAWTTGASSTTSSRSKIWGSRGGGDISSDAVTDDDTLFVVDVQRQRQRVLVLMDNFCEYHGKYLSERARDVYGVQCVHVLSEYMTEYLKSIHQEGNDEISSLTSIPMPSSQEEVIEWRNNLVKNLLQLDVDVDIDTDAESKNIELKGLICESDPGLDDAERLCMWLNVTNHNGYNEARRNKFLTISTLASKNIPSVQQQLCKTIDEATEFATSQLSSSMMLPPEEEGQKQQRQLVVVKPIRGCASDDVFLCEDIESVRSAYKIIMGSTVLGSPKKKHDSVLCQEYLIGQEYAIDTCSKNGQLKIAAVWKYDKRPQPPTIRQQQQMDGDNNDEEDNEDDTTNGRRRQVYYATKLYDDDDDDDDPLLPIIYKYLDDCLNALDIRWGVTHSEIIITADGPRLVEVNCRQHNMDFVPLTDNAIGYNLYDMLLSAYLGRDDEVEENKNIDDTTVIINEDEQLNWDLIPNYPSIRMNCAMVHLVNNKKGILKRVNEQALYEIQAMDSVWDLEVYRDFLDPGISYIEPTVDIKSDAGWIQMLHPNKEIFDRDYQRIIELMPALFEV